MSDPSRRATFEAATLELFDTIATKHDPRDQHRFLLKYRRAVETSLSDGMKSVLDELEQRFERRADDQCAEDQAKKEARSATQKANAQKPRARAYVVEAAAEPAKKPSPGKPVKLAIVGSGKNWDQPTITETRKCDYTCDWEGCGRTIPKEGVVAFFWSRDGEKKNYCAVHEWPNEIEEKLYKVRLYEKVQIHREAVADIAAGPRGRYGDR